MFPQKLWNLPTEKEFAFTVEYFYSLNFTWNCQKINGDLKFEVFLENTDFMKQDEKG